VEEQNLKLLIHIGGLPHPNSGSEFMKVAIQPVNKERSIVSGVTHAQRLNVSTEYNLEPRTEVFSTTLIRRRH